MTPLCYVLAGCIAAAIALATTIAVWWHSAIVAKDAAVTAQVAADRNQAAAEAQRDTEKAGRVKAEAERDAALKQLHDTQAARNAAEGKATTDAAAAVTNAPDALAALSAELQADARTDNPRPPGNAGTDGHGHA